MCDADVGIFIEHYEVINSPKYSYYKFRIYIPIEQLLRSRRLAAARTARGPFAAFAARRHQTSNYTDRKNSKSIIIHLC